MKEREKTAFPQKCQKMEEKVTHCMRMRKEIRLEICPIFLALCHTIPDRKLI